MASELLIYFPLRHCLQIYHLIGFCPAVTRVWPQKRQKNGLFLGNTDKKRGVTIHFISFFLNYSCLILVEKYHKLCYRVEVNTFLSSYFSSYFQQGLAQDFIAVQGKLIFVPVALRGSWCWQGRKTKRSMGSFQILPSFPLLRGQPATCLLLPKTQAGELERQMQGLEHPWAQEPRAARQRRTAWAHRSSCCCHQDASLCLSLALTKTTATTVDCETFTSRISRCFLQSALHSCKGRVRWNGERSS